MLKKTLTISLLSLLLFAGLGAGYTYFKENKANIMNLAASAASAINFGKDINLGNNCIKWTDGDVCSKSDVGGGGGGDITAVYSGEGTKGGSSSGDATIQFDCSEVDGTGLGCSGEDLYIYSSYRGAEARCGSSRYLRGDGNCRTASQIVSDGGGGGGGGTLQSHCIADYDGSYDSCADECSANGWMCVDVIKDVDHEGCYGDYPEGGSDNNWGCGKRKSKDKLCHCISIE